MSETDAGGDEFAALQTVLAALQPLPTETRRRLFDTAATFFGMNTPTPNSSRTSTTSAGSDFGLEPSARKYPAFSADMSLSPKEFVLEKEPRSDVERIAVLAYYLTHYLGTPHFKTLDLSKLNTDAAQPKFSNAANSVSNAAKRGYLVPSTKGQKQLSGAGERFVAALPDREAARAAMTAAQPRRRAQKRAKKPAASTNKP